MGKKKGGGPGARFATDPKKREKEIETERSRARGRVIPRTDRRSRRLLVIHMSVYLTVFFAPREIISIVRVAGDTSRVIPSSSSANDGKIFGKEPRSCAWLFDERTAD